MDNGRVAYNEGLASRLRDVLGADPRRASKVEEKKMFGGVSFMLDGQMCCGVLKDELTLRIGAERMDSALAQPHTRVFDFGGRPGPGMIYVALPGVESDEQLNGWVQQAIDYVETHPRTEPAKKKSGAKKGKS